MLERHTHENIQPNMYCTNYMIMYFLLYIGMLKRSNVTNIFSSTIHSALLLELARWDNYPFATALFSTQGKVG